MNRFNMDKLKNMVDEAKSQVKQKMGTDTERKIEEALSNQNWGASSTLLNDLSQLTFDYDAYNLIMRKIWEALDGEGRQWRTVFKALTLLEHLVKNGTERVVENARDHMFKIRTLSSFSYHDGAAEKGAGIRDKSKLLLDLLNDNDKIREEREKSRRLRDKYIGIGSRGGYGGESYGGSSGYSGGGGYSSGGGGGYGNNGYGNSSSRYDDSYGNSKYDGYSSRRRSSDDRDDSYASRKYSDDRNDRERRSSNASDRSNRSKKDRQNKYDDDEGSEEEVRVKKRSGKKKGSRKKKQEEDDDDADIAAIRAPGGTPSSKPSLLDNDFFGAEPTTSAPATAGNTFDPFSAPSSQPTAQQSSVSNDLFGAFQSATPTQQQSQPFQSSTPTQQQQPFQNNTPTQQQFQQNFMASPQQQQGGFDPFSSPNPAPTTSIPPAPQFSNMNSQPMAGNMGMGSSMRGPAAMNQFPPMNQSNMNSQNMQQPVNNFGAFQSAPQQQHQPQPQQSKPARPANTNDAWGSGLFDLSNLQTNQPKSNPNTSHPGLASMSRDSFKGLDTLAGMPNKPMGQSNMQPNMNQPMQQGGYMRPMGQPMSGGMNMGMQGSMGMGMMQQQQAQGMGYGMQNMNMMQQGMHPQMNNPNNFGKPF